MLAIQSIVLEGGILSGHNHIQSWSEAIATLQIGQIRQSYFEWFCTGLFPGGGCV